MDAQRLDEIISAAGFTPECYQHKGEAVVSVTLDRNIATPLTDLLVRCDSAAEGLELVCGVSMRQTPTELILFWPDAHWII